jgi:hypothetical protein
MSIVALSSFFCFARWRTLFRPVRTAFRAPHGGVAGSPRGSPPALPSEGRRAAAPSAATRPAAEPRGLIAGAFAGASCPLLSARSPCTGRAGAPVAARICSGSAAQPFCSAKPEIHRVGP